MHAAMHAVHCVMLSILGGSCFVAPSDRKSVITTPVISFACICYQLSFVYKHLQYVTIHKSTAFDMYVMQSTLALDV